MIANEMLYGLSRRCWKQRYRAAVRAFPIIAAGVGVLLLLGCGPPTPISEDAYQALLMKKMDSLGFTIPRLQPHWRHLAVSGNTVLGWSNGRASIHLYHYQFSRAGDVMSEVASAFDVTSEKHTSNWATGAIGFSGLKVSSGSQIVFSKYVAIPSETGRDTFALDYMEKLSTLPTRSILEHADLDQIAAELDGVYTFDRLVEAFSPRRVGSGPPHGMIIDRAGAENLLKELSESSGPEPGMTAQESSSPPEQESTKGAEHVEPTAGGSALSQSPKVAGGPPEKLLAVQSPDGQRSIEVIREPDGYYFIIDQQKSQPYDEIGIDPPVFSQDSKHYAYVIHDRNRLAVVLDGQVMGRYLDVAANNTFVSSGEFAYIGPHLLSARDGYNGLVFSPDSRRLAYAVWTGEDEMAVVIDGQIGPAFRSIGRIGIYFSPDSKSIAYLGERDGSWHVVVGSQLSAGFKTVGSEGLRFSEAWTEVEFSAVMEEDLWIPVRWFINENRYEYDREDPYYLASKYQIAGHEEQARRLLEVAASSEDHRAQYTLGTLYRQGFGVPRDESKAIEWFSKSAEQGNEGATTDLGALYYSRGDYAKASRYLMLGAVSGNQFAQANLGTMYLHGKGVERDVATAVKWLSLAAEQGNPQAQAMLREIERHRR